MLFTAISLVDAGDFPYEDFPYEKIYSPSRKKLHKKINTIKTQAEYGMRYESLFMAAVYGGAEFYNIFINHKVSPMIMWPLRLAAAGGAIGAVFRKYLVEKVATLIIKKATGPYFEVFKYSDPRFENPHCPEDERLEYLYSARFCCYAPSLADNIPSDEVVSVPRQEYKILRNEAYRVQKELIQLKRKNILSKYFIEQLFPYKLEEKEVEIISHDYISQTFETDLNGEIKKDVAASKIGRLLPFIKIGSAWLESVPPWGTVYIQGEKYPFQSSLADFAHSYGGPGLQLKLKAG